MSLLVYPYLRNQQNGKITELEQTIDANHNDLFGLESWRFRVWGATALKELGCIILPTLSKTDIYAEGAELYQLERELKQVLHQIDSPSLQLKVNKNSLEFRINNALAAIKVAKQHPNGGVYLG